MLTREGCSIRQQRLMQAVPDECAWVLIADPRHVTYFSGFHINPVSFSHGERAYLLLEREGDAVLFFDNFANPTAEYFADDTVVPTWYSKKYAVDNRDHVLLDTLTSELKNRVKGRGLIEAEWLPARASAALNGVPRLLEPALGSIIRGLRRKKEADEVALLKNIMKAAHAGHRRALEIIEPGISELEIYLEVQKAALETLGETGIVYGDFRANNVGTPKTGGPPTTYRLNKRDLFILDYSVMLQGYRSDNTNTICAGTPAAEQQGLFDLCLHSMLEGEAALKPGVKANELFAAASKPLVEQKILNCLDRHYGHGLGLAHPEPPAIVSENNTFIIEGDVITLEPGAYVKGIGGIRIEHNYLVTAEGFEVLSTHELRLR